MFPYIRPNGRTVWAKFFLWIIIIFFSFFFHGQRRALQLVHYITIIYIIGKTDFYLKCQFFHQLKNIQQQIRSNISLALSRSKNLINQQFFSNQRFNTKLKDLKGRERSVHVNSESCNI